MNAAARWRTTPVRCVYRKSDPAILMMKASQDRLGSDDADALNRSMERGIFVERAMNSRPIIIGNILPKDPTQMRLPKHDHVVETFPSDRADQPLGVRILPRRAWRNGLVADAMARNRRLTVAP
jgi:hypothetical protein